MFRVGDRVEGKEKSAYGNAYVGIIGVVEQTVGLDIIYIRIEQTNRRGDSVFDVGKVAGCFVHGFQLAAPVGPEPYEEYLR